jgi:hypothetical protein
VPYNAEEVVFSVSGSTAVLADEITLAVAGLREREHLQEWVLAHPSQRSELTFPRQRQVTERYHSPV